MCIQVCVYSLFQGCGIAILNVAIFAVLFTLGSICGIFRYIHVSVHDNLRNIEMLRKARYHSDNRNANQCK